MTMATANDYMWTTTPCNAADPAMLCTNDTMTQEIMMTYGSNSYSLWNYTDVNSMPPMMATTWGLPKTN